MKRPIVIIAIGILLLLVLTVTLSGERIVSKDKAQIKVERKTINVETTPRSFERDSGVSTYESSVVEQPTSTDDYNIPWQSINAGGGHLQSTNYQISSSIGQSVIGYATSDNYQAGIGYWYGIGGEACDCGDWGDVDGSGGVPKPPDVTFMVQYVYFDNDMRVPYANCPYEVGDVDCSGGAPKPMDVTFYVQYVYFENDMFCPDPCGP